MRVVVAPDSFGSALSAVEAAEAIAAGWREVAPGDDLVVLPMSDGGPGFVDALHASRGGALATYSVPGPLTGHVDARCVVIDGTLYLEAAQVCGIHLVDPSAEAVATGHTGGLGTLMARYADDVDRIVVGVGGTATNDGGSGMIRALGWRLLDARGGDLGAGGLALRDVADVEPKPLRWWHRPQLVVATDVDNPLLGPNGASAVYGPQKGADRALVLDLDDALRAWADVAEAASERPGTRELPGAGAGGGLGFGLLVLGGSRTAGFALVADAVGLADALLDADVVVTGEGAFDATSLRGKVAAGVAGAAQQRGLPCVVVAGRVEVGRRDAAAAGIDDLYAVSDVLGSPEAGLAAGAAGVTAAAARAARAWARTG